MAMKKKLALKKRLRNGENGAKEANVSLVEKILDDDTNLRYVRGDYAQNPCPSSPILTQFLTYICHLTLLVVALIAEWLRYNNYILNDWAQERVEQQDFASLGNHFDALFVNNIYRKASDVFNRPLLGVPSAAVRIKDRVTHNHGWSYEFTGDDHEVINMGSYNYLGFSQSSGPCADAATAEIARSGLGVCATRQEFGLPSLQIELEKQIARFLGVEAAICFPMGFGTNSMSLPSLANEKTLVLSDELNHSSLILGLRISRATIKVFKHNDAADLEIKLRESLFSNSKIAFNKFLIVVEGIYSMEGTILNLPEFLDVKKRYKAYLFVDEAHSIGALGATGRGIVEYWNCDARDVDILMGTLTKSFAGSGGYMAGSQKLINHLKKNTAGSIYGGVMSPPIMAQVMTSIKIMSGEDDTEMGRQRNALLARNTVYFRRRLHDLGFIVYGHENSPVIPVLTYYIPKLVCFGRETLKRGLAIVSVGYPAVPINKARVRFCISAEHTVEQIEQALKIADTVGEITRTKYLKSPV